MKVWDVESGICLLTLEGHKEFVNTVALTPDGRRAISASNDKTLKVWDLESGACLRTLEGHGYGVKVVAVTPDGRRALSASPYDTLKVWDLESGCCLKTLRSNHRQIDAVAVTPDSQLAIFGSSYDKTLDIFELESGELVANFTAEAEIEACATGPDGVTFIAGDSLGRVHFLRLENLDMLESKP
jgi:WD40 repeat protein